jgi:hypothetical protein
MHLIHKVVMGRAWVVTILFAVATLAGATVFVTNRPRQTGVPPVVNKTQALQVADVQIEGTMLSIQLKNVSGKTIAGYSLSLGPGSGIDVDFPYTEYKNPGDTFADRVPMYRDGKIVSVVIESIVFRNRSFEGDDKAAARMINRRLGEREQLTRALRLIENTLRKPDGELPAATQILEQDILSLATSADQSQIPLAVPSQVDAFWRKLPIESGMSSGKEKIHRKIQALKKGDAYGASLRNDLSSIAEECRNIINTW